jgi:REP element-mobilizing transposase RayT
MARPIRIERAGGWYHITARGNERRPIYRENRDRQHFCELLGEMVSQYNLVLHAFVLMDNHYHLLLELREANLSRAVQWLNTSYSVWFNRRHDRCGHLFQGRFKSVILEAARWALLLSRYIHLNPVRTSRLGLDKGKQRQIRVGAQGAPPVGQVRERIAHLRRYRWSSYRAYIGLALAPAWLGCRRVLELGGGRQGEARRRYRDYVEAAVREGLDQSPWEELKEQVVLGSLEFVRGLRAHLGGDELEQRGARRLREQRPDLAWVIRCVEVVKGEKWEEFRDRHGDRGRDQVLYLGRKACGLKLRELAEAAGVKEYGTVAMAVKRFTCGLARDRTLREEYGRIMQMLNVKM